jgi:hypothetical protein
VVVGELNLMSFYCARELQIETGKPYSKYYTDDRIAYDLPYEESPPTRLLALNLILSYWIGWLDASRSHHLDTEPISAWKRMDVNKGAIAYFEEFLDITSPLKTASKLGSILFQLPPSGSGEREIGGCALSRRKLLRSIY